MSNSRLLPQAGCYIRVLGFQPGGTRSGTCIHAPSKASASAWCAGGQCPAQWKRRLGAATAERNAPIIRVVFLAKVSGQEERCGGHDTMSRARSAHERRADAQSMKPFHAETEALRAVSTVPPMTTSFWARRTGVWIQERRCHSVTTGLTRVSWMGLLFPERGESKFLMACMSGGWEGEGRTRAGRTGEEVYMRCLVSARVGRSHNANCSGRNTREEKCSKRPESRDWQTCRGEFATDKWRPWGGVGFRERSCLCGPGAQPGTADRGPQRTPARMWVRQVQHGAYVYITVLCKSNMRALASRATYCVAVSPSTAAQTAAFTVLLSAGQNPNAASCPAIIVDSTRGHLGLPLRRTCGGFSCSCT